MLVEVKLYLRFRCILQVFSEISQERRPDVGRDEKIVCVGVVV